MHLLVHAGNCMYAFTVTHWHLYVCVYCDTQATVRMRSLCHVGSCMYAFTVTRWQLYVCIYCDPLAIVSMRLL